MNKTIAEICGEAGQAFGGGCGEIRVQSQRLLNTKAANAQESHKRKKSG